MVDQDKRDTLVKLSAVAAAPLLSVPGLASSGCEHHNIAANDSPREFEHTDLLVTIKPAIRAKGSHNLCRVSLSNRSDQDLRVNRVNPGIFHSNGISFDLNKRLNQEPIRVGAGGQYHFWLTASEAGRKSVLPMIDADGQKVKIKVVTQTESVEHSGQVSYLASSATAVVSLA